MHVCITAMINQIEKKREILSKYAEKKFGFNCLSNCKRLLTNKNFLRMSDKQQLKISALQSKSVVGDRHINTLPSPTKSPSKPDSSFIGYNGIKQGNNCIN